MQLVIRVLSRPDSDPKTHADRTHRGDVIVVMPDTHIFSEFERTNPEWRIIKINLTESEGMALKTEEVDAGNVKLLKWKRINRLNLDLPSPSYPNDFSAFIADDSRAIQIFDYPDNKRSILTANVVNKGLASDYVS